MENTILKLKVGRNTIETATIEICNYAKLIEEIRKLITRNKKNLFQSISQFLNEEKVDYETKINSFMDFVESKPKNLEYFYNRRLTHKGEISFSLIIEKDKIWEVLLPFQLTSIFKNSEFEPMAEIEFRKDKIVVPINKIVETLKVIFEKSLKTTFPSNLENQIRKTTTFKNKSETHIGFSIGTKENKISVSKVDVLLGGKK